MSKLNGRKSSRRVGETMDACADRRNWEALQQSRAARLAQCAPPTPEEIEAEAEAIAQCEATCTALRDSAYSGQIGRYLSGGMTSAGMDRVLAGVGEVVPTEEHRRLAYTVLCRDAAHLAHRLGVPVPAWVLG